MRNTPIATLAMIGGLGAAMVGSAASVSHAATIVNWGGNMVTETQDLILTGTTTDPAALHHGGFDTNGDPLQLSPASGYTGSPFYGHVRITGTGGGNDTNEIKNDFNGDILHIKFDSRVIDALMLWRQADFLEGMDSGNVAFDSTSTMTLGSVSGVNAGNGPFASGRAVIRLEGGSQDGYYISQEAPFGNGTLTANPTALTWLAYDPASDLGEIDGTVTNLVSNGRIEQVTEVGVYTFTPSSGTNRFEFRTFEVTAVPEPGAVGLLAGAGLLALRRRSRRN